MNLEQQVCSLELAKKLKELGVKQESLFWHVWDGERDYFLYHNEQVQVYEGKRNHILLHDGTIKSPGGQVLDKFSAFTVAELGEMLSPHLRKSIWLLEIRDSMNQATYMENEADARANMLIYLLENKLITI